MKACSISCRLTIMNNLTIPWGNFSLYPQHESPPSVSSQPLILVPCVFISAISLNPPPPTKCADSLDCKPTASLPEGCL